MEFLSSSEWNPSSQEFRIYHCGRKVSSARGQNVPIKGLSCVMGEGTPSPKGFFFFDYFLIKRKFDYRMLMAL